MSERDLAPIAAALDMMEGMIAQIESEHGMLRSLEQMRADGDTDVAALDRARAALAALRRNHEP